MILTSVCQKSLQKNEHPRLPLEGKLSASRPTDEVCGKMPHFKDTSGKFATCSTSSGASRHLPLKGKAFGCSGVK